MTISSQALTGVVKAETSLLTGATLGMRNRKSVADSLCQLGARSLVAFSVLPHLPPASPHYILSWRFISGLPCEFPGQEVRRVLGGVGSVAVGMQLAPAG